MTIARASDAPAGAMRRLDRRLRPGRALAGAIGGKTVLVTGASSGIGRAAASKLADAGAVTLMVARSADKLERARRAIEARGGSAHAYAADLSDMEAVDRLASEVLSEHPAIDILVNNAGRSIRRSLELSYARFHDYQRTMQLNYFAAVKLMLAVLPQMRARRAGHVINISSIGVQTHPPRFSAYVASKAALDGFTAVAASECLGDNVHFTTIHMPLVRTPMSAPTKIYDSFPAITADEAAGLIARAIRDRPRYIDTALGTLGAVTYALAPGTVDQALHQAYEIFPESAAARGAVTAREQATPGQVRLARVLRGIHW